MTESAGLGRSWWVQKMSGIENDNFSIRTFCYPDDYEQVYTIWQSAGPGIHVRRSDEPQEIQKKLQRDPDLFLVAEVDGRIVGTVLGGFDGRRGMVYHLAVQEGHRSKGLGEKLMIELERRLKDKGCIRYYLLVTYDNPEAVHFYEKRGWTRMDLHTLGKDIV
jgi:ribosomal protein S18 acetylase RimI-like enzyme